MSSRSLFYPLAVPEIEFPDSHFLAAAVGWMELNNRAEAKLELQRISPAARMHPDVLELSVIIHSEDKDWPESLNAARKLIDTAPERAMGWLQQAYALRRVQGGGLQAAWDALLPAVERFPKEANIPYNLACYACQMGKLNEAEEWLRRAFKVGRKHVIKSMALSDDDLKPLWTTVAAWDLRALS